MRTVGSFGIGSSDVSTRPGSGTIAVSPDGAVVPGVASASVVSGSVPSGDVAPGSVDPVGAADRSVTA